MREREVTELASERDLFTVPELLATKEDDFPTMLCRRDRRDFRRRQRFSQIDTINLCADVTRERSNLNVWCVRNFGRYLQQVSHETPHWSMELVLFTISL